MNVGSLASSSIPVISAWMGGPLSYIERLCLTSALDVGHRVILYCYSNLEDVPLGVEVRDASDILAQNQFLKYRNGSYALGSNIFRYRALSSFPCIWIDTDLLFLAPLNFETDHIFGWEDSNYINPAVLKLPMDSLVLRELRSFAEQPHIIAPWWDETDKRKQSAAILAGNPTPLADLPWATIGPKLVTHLVGKHGITRKALPADVFYPVHWRDYQEPFDPDTSVENRISAQTVTVHLWNHMLGPLRENLPHPESYIGQACKRYKIETL